MSFKITWSTHIKCILLCLVITAVLNNQVNAIMDNFISGDMILYPTAYPIINFYIYIILIMVPVTIAHEYIHGAVYRLFGGRVKHGFKGIYAYTREVSGIPIGRVKFIIVLLSPLILISTVSLFIGGWFFGMVYLLNLLGSSGDMYMAASLLRYRRGCMIVDREYGYDVV